MATKPDRDPPWEPGELRVLVVDDEPDVRLGLRMLAESLRADVNVAASAEEALAVAERTLPHVILSDISMPGRSGLDLLDSVLRRQPATQFILITGFGTIEMAVSALQRGASHFITKPFNNSDILGALRRYGREALLNEQVRRLKKDSPSRAGGEFIARDPRTKAVLELVRRVAPTPATVLIEGESGTGKEQVARELHASSASRDRPFLAINTAALPDTLLESELFGHHRGAFTGADSDRKGIFEQAAGGTVFLDEIALMSMAFQDKLLRVLQERSIVPLGTSSPVDVDFRLLAATSRNLQERVRRGEFHEDLYYRLEVVRIEVPPLRERPGDILALAAHFLSRYAGQLRPGLDVPQLSDDAIEELQRHSWPGNVRELENCIQRALVLSRDDTIHARHLGIQGDAPGGEADRALSYGEGKQQAVRVFQRRYIDSALRQSGGNITQAAEQCGLTRAALQRIMRSLGLDRESFLKS